MRKQGFAPIVIAGIIAVIVALGIGGYIFISKQKLTPLASPTEITQKEAVESRTSPEMEITTESATTEESLTAPQKEEPREQITSSQPTLTPVPIPVPAPSPQPQPPPANTSSQSVSVSQVTLPKLIDELKAWARQYNAGVYIVKTSQSDILSRTTGYDPALGDASLEATEELKENIVNITENFRKLPSYVAEYIRDEPIFISLQTGPSQPSARCPLLAYPGCDGSLGSEYVPPGLFSPSSTFYARKGFPPGEGFELFYFGQGIFLHGGDGYLALHEFGHVVDAKGIHMTMGRAKLLESTDAAIRTMYDEYDRLFQVPKEISKADHATLPSGYITFYSASNSDENFAEHFTYYIIYSEVFRTRAEREPLLKEKYYFLKRYVFKGVEYE